MFFVTSGLRFNLNALFASPSTVARVPLFLLAIYLARGLPAIVYVRLLGRSRSVIAGVLQATSLTVIVAATQIGLQLGVVSQASATALVAAGLLSVGDLPGPRTRAATPRAPAQKVVQSPRPLSSFLRFYNRRRPPLSRRRPTTPSPAFSKSASRTC